MGDGKKKKIAIISVASIVLAAAVVAGTVGIVLHHRNKSGGSPNGNAASTSLKAVESLCAGTDYKKACVDSLSAANTTDTKKLILAGFDAAVRHVLEAGNQSALLRDLEKDNMTRQALKICAELFDDAVYELRRSVETVANFDFTTFQRSLIPDLKNWIGAAVVYHETCLDGFENTTGDAGAKMRRALNASAEITRNGLALVTKVESLLSSFSWLGGSSRRLLEEEDPAEELPPRFEVPPGARNLLAAAPEELKPDLVVAKDGSGKVKTIGEALNLIPKQSPKRFVVYVKAGVYNEVVILTKDYTNVMLIGDGPTKTRITNNKNFADGVKTLDTATFAALGDMFIARDIGFENTAGPQKHQAVALRIQSDSIFYNCHIDGYQDTLYTHTKRQYFRDCTISGTIDFIFGVARAFFQDCTLVVRKPMDNQANIVTAQGHAYGKTPSGIVLRNCSIVADPAYSAVRKQIKTYLGRPWKELSTTVILDSFIDDCIDPDGWKEWSGDFGIKTCYYAELNNRGPGANKDKRVKWPGVKTITPKDAADEWLLPKFYGDDGWFRSTGLPYFPGEQ